MGKVGRPKKKITYFLLLGLLGSLIFLNQRRLSTFQKQEVTGNFSLLLSKDLYPVLSLGFKDFFDDLVYLWVLDELGQDSKDIRREVLDDRVFSFLKLSPRIESFYTLSCFVYLFELQDKLSCLKVLESAELVFSDNWRIFFTLGYLYAFEIGDVEKASYYYEKASLKKNDMTHYYYYYLQQY